MGGAASEPSECPVFVKSCPNSAQMEFRAKHWTSASRSTSRPAPMMSRSSTMLQRWNTEAVSCPEIDIATFCCTPTRIRFRTPHRRRSCRNLPSRVLKSIIEIMHFLRYLFRAILFAITCTAVARRVIQRVAMRSRYGSLLRCTSKKQAQNRLSRK
jgi:hypothetical protein